MTDNGNFILDWVFKENFEDWRRVNQDIKMIPGKFFSMKIFTYFCFEIICGIRRKEKLVPYSELLI